MMSVDVGGPPRVDVIPRFQLLSPDPVCQITIFKNLDFFSIIPFRGYEFKYLLESSPISLLSLSANK